MITPPSAFGIALPTPTRPPTLGAGSLYWIC